MSKKNKDTKVAKIIPTTKINAAWYPLDIYLAMFPENDVEEWADRMCEGDLLSFVEDVQEITGSDENTPVTIVPIDEEYLHWLDDEELPDNSKNRIKYVNSVSEAHALELLVKYAPIELYGIPVNIIVSGSFPQKMEMALSQDETFGLKKYLENIFGENNVAVLPYLIKPDMFYTNAENFYTDLDSYFEHGMFGIRHMFHSQTFKPGVNLARFYIPVGIKQVPITATYTLKEPLITPETVRVSPDLIMMEEEDLSSAGFPGMPSINDTDFAKNIKKSFPKNTQPKLSFLEPYLVHISGVPEEEKDFLKNIKDNAPNLKISK